MFDRDYFDPIRLTSCRLIAMMTLQSRALRLLEMRRALRFLYSVNLGPGRRECLEGIGERMYTQMYLELESHSRKGLM